MGTRTFATILAAASLYAGCAHAGDADFTIVNHTGYPIRAIYVSPARQDAWNADRADASGVLGNDQQRTFRFGNAAACKQDIKAIFEEVDAEVTWTEVDLCELTTLTLEYDRRTRKVTFVKE